MGNLITPLIAVPKTPLIRSINLPNGAPDGGGPTDPFFSDLVLLASFDGVDAATAETDRSGYGHTLTFNGSVALTADQSKWNATSLDCNNNEPLDYVSVAPVSDEFAFGDGEFTIEFWVYPTNSVGLHAYINYGDGSGGDLGFRINMGNGSLTFAFTTTGSTFNILKTFGSLGTLNGWKFVSLTRIGDNLYAHLNGAVLGTPQDLSSAIFNVRSDGGPLVIGSQDNPDPTANTIESDAYFNSVRITRAARYTADAYEVPAVDFVP